MVGNICLFILLLQEAICPSCPKMIKCNCDLSITLKERPQPFFILFHWKLPALLTLETLGHNPMSGHKWGSVKGLRTIRSFWTHKWRIDSKIKYCLSEPLPVSYHVTVQKCQVWTHCEDSHGGRTPSITPGKANGHRLIHLSFYEWRGSLLLATRWFTHKRDVVSPIFGLHCIRMLHFKNAFWVTDLSFI